MNKIPIVPRRICDDDSSLWRQKREMTRKNYLLEWVFFDFEIHQRMNAKYILYCCYLNNFGTHYTLCSNYSIHNQILFIYLFIVVVAVAFLNLEFHFFIVYFWHSSNNHDMMDLVIFICWLHSIYTHLHQQFDFLYLKLDVLYCICIDAINWIRR